jgi:hypothetical protein
MQFHDLNDTATLSELERQAYIAGDTSRAAVLGKLQDDADELNRLRSMYFALCELFPVHSTDRKVAILEKMATAWDAMQNAGEVSDVE